MLAFTAPALATFPGNNGKIVFASDRDGDFEIYVMNSDGSGQAPLTANTSFDGEPTWSPDGKRIAFVSTRSGRRDIWVMDANGLNPTLVPTPANVGVAWPSWSPDGEKVAFENFNGAGPSRPAGDIAVANIDGTGFHNVTSQSDDDLHPAWSPTGAEIAFVRHLCYPIDGNCDAHSDVWAVKPDGTGARHVTDHDFSYRASFPDWAPTADLIAWDACSYPDTCDQYYVVFTTPAGEPAGGIPDATTYRSTQPVFSPDGQEHAYVQGIYKQPPGAVDEDIYVDGTPLTTGLARDVSPDWQPIPRGYPRPKGASPLYASLVPAYSACTTPNRVHGSPLAFGSCAPPARTSPNLTVGTPDANGAGAASVGWTTLSAKPGNAGTVADEADVRVVAQITDVRNAGTLTDYTGELGLRLPVRITDRDNTGAGPATVEDTTLGIPLVCAATATTPGATCTAVTTVEAVVPGAVKEGIRSIWELSQLRVDDGGPDGDVDTPGNTPFAVQGIFAP